jgi:acetyl/propionyl-CoA carboxylase alpha subunit
VRYFVDVADSTLELEIERAPDGTFRVRAPGGQELCVTPLSQRPGLHTLSVAGRVLEVQPDEAEVRLAQERFRVRPQSQRERVATRSVAGDTRGSKELIAPMPGRIVRVSCAVGASVQKGAPLVVIEAMKMQNELCAKADEVIRAVCVASGDTVDRGAVLIEFE